MVGLIDTSTPQAAGPGFSISHQKVELDIDILSRSLKGRTELTISPHSKELRSVRLNCRQCELKRLYVNGKPTFSTPYNDPYTRTTLAWNASVHQHHMLRRKLEGHFKNPSEQELMVNLPKNIKIDDVDPFSIEAEPANDIKPLGSAKRSFSDVAALDLLPGARIGFEQPARFTPIVIVIEFVIKNIKDGMHFVGWEDGDLRYPHAYSKNSNMPGSTCCLFPCLEDRTSRSTWEILIKCAKTIGDALNHLRSSKSSQTNNVSSVEGGLPVGGKLDSFREEDKALELVVICTGDLTDEVSMAETDVAALSDIDRWRTPWIQRKRSHPSHQPLR